MTQEKLSSLLMLLDRQIVQLIIEKRGMPEKDAVRLLYNSELYAMLEQEDSKLGILVPRLCIIYLPRSLRPEK